MDLSHFGFLLMPVRRLTPGLLALLALGSAAAAACNALTGADDVIIEACIENETRLCSRASQCSGFQTCSGGAWGDCGCDAAPAPSQVEPLQASCAAGTHDCDGTCRRDDSVNSCGDSCSPCPMPDNAAVTCNGGQCRVACLDGFARVDSGPTNTCCRLPAVAACDVATNCGCTSGQVCSAQGPTRGTCCSPPPFQQCDLLTDCGCASGQTCSTFVGRNSCRAVPGPAVAAESYGACTMDTDCPDLHSCITGACKKHCQAAADCGWNGAQCSDSGRAGLSVCSRQCDPVGPQQPRTGLQPCGAGLSCGNVEGGSDCFSSAGAALGASCTFNSDCRPSLFCGSDTHRCGEWCEVGGNGCANGTCSSFGTPIFIGGVEFGACTG